MLFGQGSPIHIPPTVSVHIAVPTEPGFLRLILKYINCIVLSAVRHCSILLLSIRRRRLKFDNIIDRLLQYLLLLNYLNILQYILTIKCPIILGARILSTDHYYY